MNLFFRVIALRKIVICAALGLVVMGMASFLQMPRQEDPSIKINRVRIIIPYPGADPTKTEKLVTKVLEEEIAQIDSVEDVVSISKNNIASIEVFFYYDTNIKDAIEELKDTVRDMIPKLPPEALEPEIFDEIEKSFPLIAVMTGEKYSLLELEAWMEDYKDECANVSGVINSELRGELEETIYVSLDLEKVSKYHITMQRIINALSARNDLAPGGIIKLESKDFLIQTQGEFKSVRELEDVIVDIAEKGNPIYIRDIATVHKGHKDLDYKVRYNGQQAIALAISMREGHNVLKLEQDIQVITAKFKQKLPPGMELRICINQAKHVHRKLNEVYSNLFQGIVCVIIILFFFIGFRESTIISISIPVTVIISLFFLNILGVRLEQMSIASFVVALGLMVDNSIVVIENLHDNIRKSKEGLIETFANSMQEVAPSITSGTLTTIAAFIPMLFMGGDVGAYIRSIPIVMIVTLSCSLVLSLSVTAILYFWFHPKELKYRKKKKDSWLLRRYRKLIRFSLKRRYAFLFLALLFIAGSLWVAKGMDRQLFPTVNRPQYIVNVFLPEGGNLDKCQELAENIEKIMLDRKRFPEVSDIACFLGNGSPKFYFNELGDKQLNNPSYMEVVVNLHSSLPDGNTMRSTNELVSTTQKILDQEIIGARIRVREFKSGKAFRAPVILRLTGNDLQILKNLASDLKQIVESVPGTKNVYDNLGESTFKVQVVTDPYALNQLGLIHSDISSDIRTAFSGKVATTFLSGDDETDVVVRLHENDRKDFENIRQLYFAARFSGAKIPFNQIAKLQLHLEKAQINRYNQSWSASVLSDVEGRLPDAVIRDIRKKLENWKTPPGFSLAYEGENKEVAKSFGSLRVAGFFAILLIYLILATEFNSLMQPVIILFILPLSIAGAIFGLKITGSPLGFMSMMGFVSLIGIVVNDAILLVDFANAKIKSNQTGSTIESMENYSAILTEVAEKRLKPIFATSITTIVSLLPLAMFGGSLWSPFAWTVITGLCASTFLTLVYVPCFFRALEDIRVYLRILPAINIDVYTKDIQLERDLYRFLSTQSKLTFLNPAKKIITAQERKHTDMVIIDEQGMQLSDIIELLELAKHAPHISSLIISNSCRNHLDFLHNCKRQGIELSNSQKSLFESTAYMPREETKNLSKVVKEQSNKLGEVLWDIWSLSRVQQR